MLRWILNLAALSPDDPPSMINASIVSAEVNTLALEPEAPTDTTETKTKTQPESGLFTRPTRERPPVGPAGEIDPFIN